MPGNGDDDDDDFCRDDYDEHSGGGLDTWINWFRTEGGQNIPHRGKIVATKVIVDFQGTVAQGIFERR
jgi:hypothetical protein